MALILSGTDLQPLFTNPASMDSLSATIEESLRAYNQGTILNQSAVQTPLADGRRAIRGVTATLPGTGSGMRLQSLGGAAKDGHFNVLFSAETGDFLALVAGAELNVWRTGAPAGVACRCLARREVKTLGLLGSGRQAKGQLLAIRRALPSLEKVRVYSPTEKHRTSFAQQMSSWLQIEIEPAPTARAAVEGADIVDVATSSRSPVVEADWISPAALVISISSGQLPPELVAGSRVFVSSREELSNFRPPREPYSSMITTGSWPATKIAGELGEVILGKVPGHESENQVVLFELLGMPAWDVAATAWAYRWAVENNIGSAFSLA
jgi:ornithine cyclodeaminase/alanine dehydrogenase-like protein (mu-crystallin family)